MAARTSRIELVTTATAPLYRYHPAVVAQAAATVATRWCVQAGDDEEAWRALGGLRGLRIPGREGIVNPAELRARADAMPRDDLLRTFPRARDPENLLVAYASLVDEMGADYVSIQVATADRVGALETIGTRALPELRS